MSVSRLLKHPVNVVELLNANTELTVIAFDEDCNLISFNEIKKIIIFLIIWKKERKIWNEFWNF